MSSDSAARQSGRVALVALLATRIPILLVGGAAVAAIGTWPPPVAEGLWRVSSNELLNLLARWDTFWYHSIATAGYHRDPTAFHHENVVFFPLYPLLMRWGAHVTGGSSLVAGLIVSLASFTAAMAVLYRLAAEDLGEEQAAAAIVLLATYPFALFYSAVYTESLFLFLTAGAFYAMRRDRLFLVGLLGLAAGLARPNGFWLSVPLVLLVATSADRSLRARRVRAIAAALMPVVGTAIFSIYLHVRVGDGLAWVHGQAAWGIQTLLRAGAHDDPPFARATSAVFTDVLRWAFDFAAFAGAVWALKPIFRRFGPAYAAWVALGIFPPVTTHLFMSQGRFTATLFPLFFWLATVVPRTKLWRVAGGFAVIQIAFAILFFLWRPIV